jgi:hypothetical protein
MLQNHQHPLSLLHADGAVDWPQFRSPKCLSSHWPSSQVTSFSSPNDLLIDHISPPSLFPLCSEMESVATESVEIHQNLLKKVDPHGSIVASLPSGNQTDSHRLLEYAPPPL